MGSPLRALIVEDAEDDVELLLRQLRRDGYDPAVERVDSAVAMANALDRQTWDVVISDYLVPGFGGVAALRLLKERELDLPFILVSGGIGEDLAVEAMRAGADDYLMKGNLTRLGSAIERELREAEVRRKRRQAEEALQHSFEQLRRVLTQTVEAIALMSEIKDPYTAGHQRRVAELASDIGRQMGLPEHQVEGLRVAGLLHDIGKIAVPAELLTKPGRLSEHEFAIIKAHPEVGHAVLRDVEFPWPIARAVLQHHERLDGSGYPAGLSGDEVILEARVLAVADVVEAMSSHRPYRPSLGVAAALGEISGRRTVLYDPAVVDACRQCLRRERLELQQAAELATIAGARGSEAAIVGSRSNGKAHSSLHLVG